MHGDCACSKCHQRGRDLRGCDPRSSVSLKGLLKAFTENGIVPFPPDHSKCLVQAHLKLRRRQDSIRQSVSEGHTITLPEWQFEKFGNNKPFDLVPDLGVEHQLACTEVIGYPISAHRLCSGCSK